MDIGDERLIAYADGELDEQARAEIDAAAARDPKLAARLARWRLQRERVAHAYDPVLEEAAPERLLEAINRPRAAAEVVDLRAARERERARKRPAQSGEPRWTWRQWAALAACIGLGVTFLLPLGSRLKPSPGPSVVARGDALLAGGPLAHALDRDLASAPAAAGPVRVGLTFVDHAGAVCRTFTPAQGEGLAGVACRDGRVWRLRATADAAAAPKGEYRTAAAALPASLNAAVESMIEGRPLDADAEARARADDWRPR